MDIQEYVDYQKDLDELSDMLVIMCGRNLVKKLTQVEMAYLMMIKTSVIADILEMQLNQKEQLDEISLMDMTATILLGMMIKLNGDCNKSLKDIYTEYKDK